MMSMQGTWADHIMIQAVADAMNFKIYVIIIIIIIIIIITGSANHPFVAVLGTELQKNAVHDIGLKAYEGACSCRYTGFV